MDNDTKIIDLDLKSEANFSSFTDYIYIATESPEGEGKQIAIFWIKDILLRKPYYRTMLNEYLQVKLNEVIC